MDISKIKLPDGSIYEIKKVVDKIRDIIGPGGKIINKIIDETGVKIDIEDDGRVSIISNNAVASKKAIEIIQNIVKEIEVGDIYLGKVTKITTFGAFVECLPGKEGLLHISRISKQKINRVSDVLSLGEIIDVKCIDIDDKGRVVLSKRALESKDGNDD